MWSIKPKIFTNWPFTKIVCQLLLYTMRCQKHQKTSPRTISKVQCNKPIFWGHLVGAKTHTHKHFPQVSLIPYQSKVAKAKYMKLPLFSLSLLVNNVNYKWLPSKIHLNMASTAQKMLWKVEGDERRPPYGI